MKFSQVCPVCQIFPVSTDLPSQGWPRQLLIGISYNNNLWGLWGNKGCFFNPASPDNVSKLLSSGDHLGSRVGIGKLFNPIWKWTLTIRRNLMIPGIRWSQVFDDLKEISIGRMDFDNPKVYSDTSISDRLVHHVMTAFKHHNCGIISPPSSMPAQIMPSSTPLTPE